VNFADEWWVKLYTRDTTTWKLLSWQARTLLLHMFRKVNRAGEIDVGEDGIEGLAALVDLPLEEVVEPGMEMLLKRGTVTKRDATYAIPRFVEAQETPSSDRARARKHRARVTVPSRNVTPESQNVTQPSRDVTDRHGPSRSDQIRSDQIREEREESGKPDDSVRALAETACAEINRLTGSKYQADSTSTLKLCKALARAKRTPDDVRAVVADKHREWGSNPEMRGRVCPATLLALANFEKYLDTLRSRPGAKPSTPTLRAVPPPDSKRDDKCNVKSLYSDEELDAMLRDAAAATAAAAAAGGTP